MISELLRGAAPPLLHRLADDSRETVALRSIESDEALDIDQRSRGGALGFRIEIGRRAPLHCTAGGEALLALPRRTSSGRILDRIRLTRFTDRDLHGRGRARRRSRSRQGARLRDLAWGTCGGSVFCCGPDLRSYGARCRCNRRVRTKLPALERSPARGGTRPDGRRAPDLRKCRRGSESITPSAPAQRNSEPQLECVLPRGGTAEGPVWIADEQKLYWVDTPQFLFTASIRSRGSTKRVSLPRLVSAVAPRRGGGFVALTQEGLETFDFATGTLAGLVDREAHILDNRFNDGKCDRAGRMWAGSMSLDASQPNGSLYAVSGDLSFTGVDNGFTVANGLDWSPDGRTFYFVESRSRPHLRLRFRPFRGRSEQPANICRDRFARGPSRRTCGRFRKGSSGARSGTAGACAAMHRMDLSTARCGCRFHVRRASCSAERT